MTRSLSFASLIVVSSLLLSPLAMAEESPAFVAQTQGHEQALEHRQELAQKADELKTQQAASQQQKNDLTNHS